MEFGPEMFEDSMTLESKMCFRYELHTTCRFAWPFAMQTTMHAHLFSQATILFGFCREHLYVSYFTIQFKASLAANNTMDSSGEQISQTNKQTTTDSNELRHNFPERISVRI